MNDRFKGRLWHEGNQSFIYFDLKDLWENGFRVCEAWKPNNPIELDPRQPAFITEGELDRMAGGAFMLSKDPQWSTGLKDKTGKLIYEGDILHHEWEHKGKSGQYDYKVIWSKSMASFMKIYIGGEFDKHLAGGFCFLDIEGNGKDCEDLEIIGNIYENPELAIQNS